MKNYWEQFDNPDPEFWKGVKVGVEAYAVWKDGGQFVGLMDTPLKEVYAEIDEAALKSDKRWKIKRGEYNYDG